MSVERRESTAGVRWRVRIHAGGRVVADKTFTTKRAAESWEREQKEALGGGTFVAPQRSRIPLSEVASKFLEARLGQVSQHSHRTDRDNVAAIPSKLAARPIGSITEADILRLLTDLLAGRAHSTVSRMKTTYSALWTWAVRERYTNVNVVRSVAMPSGIKQAPARDYLTPDVLAEVLDAQRGLSHRNALITEFLSLTGLRWSEFRALRVSDLQELPYPAVRVSRARSDGYDEKAPKTARGRRHVPLVQRAHDIARQWAAGKGPGDFLATSATGLQIRGTYFRRAVSWTSTARGHNIHSLRHFAASSWLRAGIPANQVAEWLGDDPRTVMKVYAHVQGETHTIESLTRLNTLPSHSPGAGPNSSNRKESGQ